MERYLMKSLVHLCSVSTPAKVRQEGILISHAYFQSYAHKIKFEVTFFFLSSIQKVKYNYLCSVLLL